MKLQFRVVIKQNFHLFRNKHRASDSHQMVMLWWSDALPENG